MLAESEERLVFGDPQIIYEGHLTKLYRRNKLSVPQYSHVQRELQRMGCIRQLRRGGGAATSVWILLREPTRELFDSESKVPWKNSRGGLRKNWQELLQQQFDDLRRTHNIQIADLQDRVEQLERKLNG